MRCLRFACTSVLISCLAGISFAQSGAVAKTAAVTPEAGFISPTKYTNAFSGFALPLPQNVPFAGMSLPAHGDSMHFLFGIQAQGNGLTILTVTAKAEGSVPDGAMHSEIIVGDKVSGREIDGATESAYLDSERAKPHAPVEIFTTFDITTAKGYWVTWMFMDGSQVELDDLKSRNIHFISE